MTDDDRKFIEDLKVLEELAQKINPTIRKSNVQRLLLIIESLQATPRLETNDIQHLIDRLETVADLLRRNEKHMAMAKILADVSALKGVIGRNLD